METLQRLADIADCPQHDGEKLEAFLRVRTILAQIRPELDGVFRGLFEKNRHERDTRTFLGRVREVLSGAELTREEFRLLMEARDVPGFAVIQTLLEDSMFREERLPVTERVIREIPMASPTPPGGRAPMCCPNIGGLEN
jgi:hypothetical protein